MPSLLVLADAPAPDELVTLDAEKNTATSRVQIAKTGKFKDPRYGVFSITAADFARWLDNFEKLHKADGRLGLPIDVDHSPEKQGKTEAAGWVTKLDQMGEDGKTPTPGELWATAEWNSLGRELIGDRRYAYLSPSYQHNFADEEGKQHGTALVGIGLTNRPFLTMATVTLSAALDAVAAAAVETGEPVDEATPDTPGHMAFLDDIRSAFELDADADEAQVLAEAKRRAEAPESAEVDERTLAAQAEAQGCIILTAADHASLAAAATQGANAAKELAASKFESAFDRALEAGRTTPAMKETFEKLYSTDAETTLSALEALPVSVNVDPDGHSGQGTGDAPADTQLGRDAEGLKMEDDTVALHNRTVELAREKGIEYGDAVELAAAELGRI